MCRLALTLTLILALTALALTRPPDYKALNGDLASGVIEVVRRSLNCGPYLDGNPLCKLMLATPPLNYNVRFQSVFSAYFAVGLRTRPHLPLCRVWAETRLHVHAMLARLLKKHPQSGVVLPPLGEAPSREAALAIAEEHCEEFEIPPLGPAQRAALRIISKFYSTAPTQ